MSGTRRTAAVWVVAAGVLAVGVLVILDAGSVPAHPGPAQLPITIPLLGTTTAPTAPPPPPTTAAPPTSEATTTEATEATVVTEAPTSTEVTTTTAEPATVPLGGASGPASAVSPETASVPPARVGIGEAAGSTVGADATAARLTISPAAVTGSYGLGVGVVLLVGLVLFALASRVRTGGSPVTPQARRWRLIAGLGCLGLAAVVGLVGWLRLSLQPAVNRQIPYLASAGMALVLLSAIGGSLIVAEQLRSDDQRLDELEAAVRHLADTLAPAIEAPARLARAGAAAVTAPAAAASAAATSPAAAASAAAASPAAAASAADASTGEASAADASAGEASAPTPTRTRRKGT